MVVVRLARGGAKKHPFYHIVVTDSRQRRDSGYIERLGYFNPFATAKETPVFLNRDRFDYWVSKGAKSSPRVSSIISKLDKGGFVVKEETKVEVKKTDTTETADAGETEDKSVAEKENTDAESTTAVEEPQQSAKADAPQTEPDLNDTAEEKQEEKQAASSAEAAKSEDGNEATDKESPTKESVADKKADG
ncbi:MAG: 30S ribosomal protein S16 [Gammaproteobacteria bacterium]|nr:30S ribosomal protein S16 [Gammaproteobacteria bacterium]